MCQRLLCDSLPVWTLRAHNVKMRIDKLRPDRRGKLYELSLYIYIYVYVVTSSQ